MDAQPKIGMSKTIISTSDSLPQKLMFWSNGTRSSYNIETKRDLIISDFSVISELILNLSDNYENHFSSWNVVLDTK